MFGFNFLKIYFNFQVKANESTARICKKCKNSIETFYKLKKKTEEEKTIKCETTEKVGKEDGVSVILGVIYSYLEKYMNDYFIDIKEYSDQLVLKHVRAFKCEKCQSIFKSEIEW